MGLKQINEADRIIFLKVFIEEILTNLSEKFRKEKNIEAEKIRQKFIISQPEFGSYKQPTIHRITIPEKKEISIKPIQKPVQPLSINQKPQSKKPFPERKLLINKFAPLNPFKKINPFLKDPTIQLVECPGPGKNLLVKKYNKIHITRTTLSQQEINKLIDYFSKEARVPLIGGILKAAVKNIIISAIVSEFVGSRFIINKITPYSIIEEKKF